MSESLFRGMADHESSHRKLKVVTDTLGRKEKACSECGETKPILGFQRGKHYTGGFRPRCKDCMNAAWRAKYADPQSGERAKKQAANASRPKKARRPAKWASQRAYQLARRYGLTEAHVDEMLARQGHRCAICGNDRSKTRSGRFHIDHCHTTGRVRGLLCNRCNLALGNLGDTPAAIQRAIKYLQSEPRIEGAGRPCRERGPKGGRR